MENYRLKSKVSVADKEFLVQTINDPEKHTVVNSLFIDGRMLEMISFPHSDEMSEEDVLSRVKLTHGEKKQELEHLLSMYQQASQSGDSDMMFSLARAFYGKNMFDYARNLFESVLSLKADHFEAYNYLGLTCLALGVPEEASRKLSRAVELRPQFADYHNNYSVALLESGFCRRAMEQCEAALKLNIYYADAYFNLGIAFVANSVTREDYEMYSSHLQKSLEMFERAAMIDPEFRSQRYEEACELLKRNDPGRSLNLFKAIRDEKRESASKRISGDFVLFQLTAGQSGHQTIDDRIEYLKNELKKNPNYVDYHHEMALCYLQKSRIDWQMAIDQFQKACQLNPKLTKSQIGFDKADQFLNSLTLSISEIARSDSK